MNKKKVSLALPSFVLAIAFAIATPCRAQSIQDFGTAVQDYFLNWFPRVTQIQSEQPHWITPLVTVTPRLEEELRYDQYFESMRDGVWRPTTSAPAREWSSSRFRIRKS